MAKKVIHIAGMSCAACVRRVEQGIAALAGVHEATVNLATSQAVVEPGCGAVCGQEKDIRQVIPRVKVSRLKI